MEIEYISDSAHHGTHAFSQRDNTTPGDNVFGAPAHDFMERSIDLNEHLVHNPQATFFLRVSGESMCDAGIHDGDIVIVDRSIKPQSGKIVIAVIDGEMLLRRYIKTFNSLTLVPDTKKLSPLTITEYHDFKIWGVVTYAIKYV
ncbi:MAG: translesion error-prone DNA polymerase V autoproteolytic subunit [Ferruginibacter sp.]